MSRRKLSLSADEQPAAKRQKREHPFERPPRFWDRLSHIPLTHDALRELERRHGPRSLFDIQQLVGLPKMGKRTFRRVCQYARRGGPDMRDVRGVSGARPLAPARLRAAANVYSTTAT